MKIITIAETEAKCDACKWPICLGQYITKDSFGQWVHERCT